MRGKPRVIAYGVGVRWMLRGDRCLRLMRGRCSRLPGRCLRTHTVPVQLDAADAEEVDTSVRQDDV